MWDAKQLKEKRAADRLSAEKLAKMLGATKESIYKWESGTKPQSKGMNRKIQNYLNGAMPVNGAAETPRKKYTKSNGTVKENDFKEKYYNLLEKYTILLEKK